MPDDVERRVAEYVQSEGTISSRVMQIMFNLDVSGTAQRLRELVDRGVLEKLGTQRRGPASSTARVPHFPDAGAVAADRAPSRRSRRHETPASASGSADSTESV